jgi:hypothetical protein
MIAQDEPFGIRIQNTTEHVVIDDVVIAGGVYGIQLANASNVTIEDALIDRQYSGIEANNVENLEIRRTIVGHGSPGPTARGVSYGIDIAAAEDVAITNTSIGLALSPLSLTEVEGATLQDAYVDGGGLTASGSRVQLSEVADLRVERTSFDRVSIRSQGAVTNFSFSYNSMTDVGKALSNGFDETRTLSQFDICGNTFRNSTQIGLDVVDVSGFTTVRGNRFLGGGELLDVSFSENTTVIRNEIRNASVVGLTIQSSDAEIHRNLIAGNEENSLLNFDINASHNWWGASDGPSGDFDGSGDPVETLNYDPVIKPWLPEPPAVGPDTVDCGVAQAEPGVKAHPAMGAAVEVHLEEELTVDEASGLGPIDAEAEAKVSANVGAYPLPLFHD